MLLTFYFNRLIGTIISDGMGLTIDKVERSFWAMLPRWCLPRIHHPCWRETTSTVKSSKKYNIQNIKLQK